jgi:hypothetical protein
MLTFVGRLVGKLIAQLNVATRGAALLKISLMIFFRAPKRACRSDLRGNRRTKLATGL